MRGKSDDWRERKEAENDNNIIGRDYLPKKSYA